ncbi:MAG: chemotaxis protein CheA [Bacteroidota bacterium]|nr:chemotaxis protein CheA [Bacteroidota bacterium]
MDEQFDYPLLTDPEMKEIVESFLIETKELLEKLDTDLIVFEKNPDDTDLVNQIFRAFHTIKGTSGFLGLNKLTEVTHRCEDILNKLRKNEAKLSSTVMDAILLSYDTIKDLITSIELNQNESTEVSGVIDVLEKVIADINSGISAPVEVVPVVQEVLMEIEDSEEHEEEIEVVSVHEIIPDKPEVKSETVKTKTEIHVDNALTDTKKADNTIRVNIERLNDLLNIASELVLGRNRLAQVNSEVALEYEGSKLSRDLSEITKQIDFMTNELQLIVMKVRLVKVGKVFNRFPRLVRDLLKETKKEAKLIIKGEDTELDKTLIEEINDPLVHLIRNSIDHGIESPEERARLGKEAIGTITLSAEQEGNNIIIYIEDDGKGIDPEKIKEKAVQKGLFSKEKAKEMSKQEAFNIIFMPGFSTAEKVTNISGRGVGMDVVKTNVTKLRGLINVESNVNLGTKIIIKLPITLAIIQGMIVTVGTEKVVIPLNSILEVVRVSYEEIYTINQQEVIRVRESILPLIEIGELIYNKDFTVSKKEWQYVVVVGIAEKRFGIKVDALVGQKEIVIKSLGSYLGDVEGIAGSTIMGDGSVLMILDLNEIINKYTEIVEATN